VKKEGKSVRQTTVPGEGILTRAQRTARHEQLTLADRAYHRLEQMIVTLKLQPGSVVTEADLIQEIEIGRTPTREALKRLETRGLVRSLPRRGVMITGLNVTDYFALLETRRTLDRLIAASAARRATREQRAALRAAAAAIKKAAMKEDMEAFMRLDHDFDDILEAAARNPFAAQAVAPLHTHCRRFWYTFRHTGDLPRTAALHGRLMMAVAQGDEAAAQKASDDLLDYLTEFTRTTVEM
jgi:DNA-binding GntR family transcriptional regulator